MQTHAPTQADAAADDMFAGTPFALPGLPTAAGGAHCLQFDGTLTRNAEVRTKPAKDGLHSVPVVCVELRSTTDSNVICCADFPFTDSTRHQAEALAKTLTKHKTVSVTAPVADRRITFTHALSIEIHQEQ